MLAEPLHIYTSPTLFAYLSGHLMPWMSKTPIRMHKIMPAHPTETDVKFLTHKAKNTHTTHGSPEKPFGSVQFAAEFVCICMSRLRLCEIWRVVDTRLLDETCSKWSRNAQTLYCTYIHKHTKHIYPLTFKCCLTLYVIVCDNAV